MWEISNRLIGVMIPHAILQVWNELAHLPGCHFRRFRVRFVPRFRLLRTRPDQRNSRLRDRLRNQKADSRRGCLRRSQSNFAQGNGPLGNPDQDKRGHQQVTDVSGQFVFRGLDWDAHDFKVVKPGYISSTEQGGFSSYEVHTDPHMGDLRFFLTPAAQVSGRVASNTGVAMKSILLTLYSVSVVDGRLVCRRGTVVWYDAHGSFVFPHLHPGFYVVLSDSVFDND